MVTVADGSRLDFEHDAGHSITVRAQSQDGSSATQVFTITVRDANDAPTGLPVVQGAPLQGQPLHADTSGIADADGLGDFSYQWLLDGQPVAGATGSSYTPGAGDVGGQISVRVSYTDGRGTAESLVSVPTAPVAAVNHAPVITSYGGAARVAMRLDENTAGVATVSATDADMPLQTLSYRIVGGADQALFTVDADTGVLRFLVAPDFEHPTDSGGRNVYEVVVSVSDGITSREQAMEVSIVDANDNPPVIQGNSQGPLVVNPAQGGVITTVVAADADRSFGAPVFSIVGGTDAARFQIQSTTGELRLLQPLVMPGFAGTMVLEVIVQADDGLHQTTQRLLVTMDFGGAVVPLPEPTGPATLLPVVVDVASGGAVEVGTLTLPAGPDLAQRLEGGQREQNEMGVLGQRDGRLSVGARTAGLDVRRVDYTVVIPRTPDDIGWVQQPLELEILAILRALVSSAGDGDGAVLAERVLPEAPTVPEGAGLTLTMLEVAGVAFTFSFALWMARGGSLLASLLAASPAWVRFDLLPVLERPRGKFAATRESDRLRTARGNGRRLSAEERFFAALPPTAQVAAGPPQGDLPPGGGADAAQSWGRAK